MIAPSVAAASPEDGPTSTSTTSETTLHTPTKILPPGWHSQRHYGDILYFNPSKNLCQWEFPSSDPLSLKSNPTESNPTESNLTNPSESNPTKSHTLHLPFGWSSTYSNGKLYYVNPNSRKISDTIPQSEVTVEKASSQSDDMGFLVVDDNLETDTVFPIYTPLPQPPLALSISCQYLLPDGRSWAKAHLLVFTTGMIKLATSSDSPSPKETIKSFSVLRYTVKTADYLKWKPVISPTPYNLVLLTREICNLAAPLERGAILAKLEQFLFLSVSNHTAQVNCIKFIEQTFADLRTILSQNQLV